MIKFFLPLSRFLVSNQLKALSQLRANKNQTLPLDFKQKLMDLVHQQPIEDKDEFIKAFKEFDYDHREIAAIYNNNISGRELIVEMHKKQEPQIMLDEAYSFLLSFQPTHQFSADLGYQNFAHYLTPQGMSNILSETERQEIKWAYQVIIKNTFYGLYLKAIKGDDKIAQVDSLKKMIIDILKEKDYQNIIWKVFLYSQIQPPNNKIIQHLYESISNVDNLNNKQLLLIASISYKTKMKLGNQKELSSLNKKFCFLLNKIQDNLDLNERIYLLLICKRHYDIYNKQEILCKPIYENIREIKNELYPDIFQLLCNFYWYAIDLNKEEQFIAENFDVFLSQNSLADILLGLIYAQSQNTELLQNLFKLLCNTMDKSGNSLQCKFYQIYYILETQYKFKLEVENIKQYKENYRNATAFLNTPVFSLAFIEMSEYLDKIAQQTNKDKQSKWKITKITTNQEFEIYEMDFFVEIETEKKKEQFYFDFIQKSAMIDDQTFTGRQRIREKVFKNEQVIYIKYDDWFKIEDKELWIRKMLGKQ